MYAENNDLPTPVQSAILPALDFTTPAAAAPGAVVQAPSFNICSGGYQVIFPPISVIEGDVADFYNPSKTRIQRSVSE